MTYAEYIGVIANITAIIALILVLRKWKWAPVFGFGQQMLWLYWAYAGEGTWPLYFAVGGYTAVYAVASWNLLKGKTT